MLPESENAYLTVIEEGEKKVFLAKIEYIRKFARFLSLPAKRSENQRINYGSRAIFNVPFFRGIGPRRDWRGCAST